jgi:hypothetical protein
MTALSTPRTKVRGVLHIGSSGRLEGSVELRDISSGPIRLSASKEPFDFAAYSHFKKLDIIVLRIEDLTS